VAANAPRVGHTEELNELQQIILVTSSVPEEGKSMLNVNLGIVYAQRGKKVLLLDGDLRTPVLRRRLNLKASLRLSSLLAADDIHDVAFLSAVSLEGIPNLQIMLVLRLPVLPSL
jgi:Mrp family chromosome partitioning ATPase